MKISGAIFDMDGTLVDSLMVWDVLWARFGEQYKGDRSFRPDPVTEQAIRTLPLREAMELLHQTCSIGTDGDELWRFATDVCAEFYEKDVPMKSGVMDFLEHLKQRDVKMCVASATAPDLLAIIFRRYELDRYFTRIFSCSEIGKGKEHPDIFDAAHAYLETEKDSTWVFEDSFVALQTAKGAGYHTVGIYDPYNFCLDQMPEVSTEYIAKGETLARLIPLI
ncbi:MAG: HAD family phosphatase [Clostridia bacterium]|nr:HAD family phosphatase [Clostridia bacterium]